VFSREQQTKILLIGLLIGKPPHSPEDAIFLAEVGSVISL